VIAQGGEGPPRAAVLRVTGIFHTGSQEFDSRTFRIPLAVAQTLWRRTGSRLSPSPSPTSRRGPPSPQAVRASLPYLEAVPFDELDRIYYRHAVDWLDAQFAFIRGIVLLVVFLGVFNVICGMAVLERTREIGTLRANGEGRLAIACGHILEAATLAPSWARPSVGSGWALSAGPLHDGVAMSRRRPASPGVSASRSNWPPPTPCRPSAWPSSPRSSLPGRPCGAPCASPSPQALRHV